MVKICARCLVVWPGGYRCDQCGGPLTHTDAPEAKDLPEVVWKNQRVDYGARRGMIVRFIGIFAGFAVALWGVRASVPLASPYNALGAAFAIGAGIAVFWMIYVGAGRAVRVWILQRGRVSKRKLARALIRPAVAPAAQLARARRRSERAG